MAPARISSMVLAFIKLVSIRRYRMVDSMTIMMRLEVVLTILHATTGTNSKNVIKESNSPLAPRLIKDPE